MHRRSFTDTVNYYFTRFRVQPPQISDPVSSGTGVIIVIPCFNEPGLVETFESLWQCEQPKGVVEIITVINSGEDAPDECIRQNRQTYNDALKWIGSHQREKLEFHILNIINLPKKHAGVGLARKIGMDEALHRFENIGSAGVIVCLDADCKVAENYLTAIEDNFAHGKTNAGTIYFEHDINRKNNKVLIEGILKYELFIRYNVRALKFSGFPYAYHTVGSCMAVRADVYALAGGMNKRKAGEDFYFLHKIIPLGNFVEINNTCVYPSPRISDRVPFGTGKTMLDWVKKHEEPARVKGQGLKGEFLTYNFSTFEDLRALVLSVDALYNCHAKSNYDELMEKLPLSVRIYLKEENFHEKLTEIIQETSSLVSFRKRFFAWFNGLKIIKFVHYARDHYYEQVPLHEACKLLLRNKNIKFADEVKEVELLQIFRELDRDSL
ncbi:MAG: glycosyltransferase [Bacteroidota bacterium]